MPLIKFSLRSLVFATVMVGSCSSMAQDATINLIPYTFEIEPVIGTLLPRDIWGTPGTMSTVGIRSSYVISPPDGAFEASVLYHSAGSTDLEDHAMMYDLSWRQDFKSDLLLAYFNIGMQYSKWNLDIDYDATGACDPANCLTDAGTYTGIRVGAGIIMPLGPNTPLRMAMTFYKGPQLILLLEAGVGIRF